MFESTATENQSCETKSELKVTSRREQVENGEEKEDMYYSYIYWYVVYVT